MRGGLGWAGLVGVLGRCEAFGTFDLVSVRLGRLKFRASMLYAVRSGENGFVCFLRAPRTCRGLRCAGGDTLVALQTFDLVYLPP